MQFTVQVEKPSNTLRKLTILVPATEVSNRFEKGLVQVQRTAKLKGFRPGHVPMQVVRQQFGADVRHQVFHDVIDESYQNALRKEKIRAVGRPKIDTSKHQTGSGEHDHGIQENQDLSFTAEVEVIPELAIKGYKGLALTREIEAVKPEDVQTMINRFLDSRAELIAKADGEGAAMGDYVDMKFDGGLVTPEGVKPYPGMKGTRVVELGVGALIPGFEEQLVGIKKGESKKVRLTFPGEYHDKELENKEAEFAVDVAEVKSKKVPPLTDELAKELGYEGVADFKAKVKSEIEKDRSENADRKLRTAILDQLIEKNPFDVPRLLVESQTRALAQDWAQELKEQRVPEEQIQMAVQKELETIRKRAESQVRSSLILENIAEAEKIDLSASEWKEEVARMAEKSGMEADRFFEFYEKNADRREDLLYRLKQDKTVKFIQDQAKIKG